MTEEEKIYKYLMKQIPQKHVLENEIFAIRDFRKNVNDYTIYVDGYISLDAISNSIEKQKLIQKQDNIIKGNECVIETQANNEKVLLEAIEKKDRIIDRMANCIYNYQICDYEITDYTYRKCEYIADDETPPCKQCIKEYFEKEEG